MAGWTRVKWSEARQVLELLGDVHGAGAEAAKTAPEDYFEALRAQGRQADAVRFLGQALPRLEAVAWAARVVRDLAPAGGDRAGAAARALRAALLWISDPTEPRRRLAQEAAGAVEITTPEHLAAMAVVFSGGSIAPEGAAALAPARNAAGRFASAAVLSAASRAPDRMKALDLALDAGADIARQGLEPVSA